MHFAIDVVPFGDYANPRNVIPLAQAAEAAGWEGLFVWDHLAYVFGFPSGDPWIILAAVAASTSRLKLGVDITPLPRRRPQVLAQTLVTLDILSQGRVIFGAGLGGVPEEFTAFGEPDDPRQRAEMLDEGLGVLDGLVRGQEMNHRGRYYTAIGVRLATEPVQKPRPPFWIGGESRPALRRAARWDGWVVEGANQEGIMAKSPQQLAEQVAYLRQHRHSQEPFEVAITGISTADQGYLANEYAKAGATWWLESISGMRGSLEDLLVRIKAGPPT